MEYPIHKYEFQLADSPRLNVADQVVKFANQLISGLERTAGGQKARRLFEGATLLLLPFLRPHFEPSTVRGSSTGELQEISRGRREASPGGAIFLFLVPDEGASTLPELARDISWLLAAGSVKESYSAADVALKRQHLVGQLIHGTTNAIRSVNAGELARLICRPRRVPPSGPEDLRIDLRSLDGTKQDTSRLEAIAAALSKSILAEDTAAALLAFAESWYYSGVLREKFQSRRRVSVERLLNEARILADNWKNAPTDRYAPIELEEEAGEPESSAGGQWILPAGYLSSGMIRGILSEILLNASQHGRREDSGTVAVRYSMSRSPRRGLVCEITNGITVGGDSTEGTDQITGFLQRTSEALSGLHGMSLKFKIHEEREVFSSLLWLGPVKAVVGKDIKNTEDIVPEWEPDTSEVT